jgi:hypothetical protein
MGWHISLQINNVLISDECAADLLDQCPHIFKHYEDDDFDGVRNEDVLWFNYDHMEHMDYMRDKKVLDVLAKHRVNGDICFSSADGDNSGSNWGYRFKDGIMIPLKGVVTYVEVAPKSKT